MGKEGKLKRVFNFKKDECYSLDEISQIGQLISSASRKPVDEDEARNFGVHCTNFGDMSDYDIFSKTVKITIEIID